MRQYRFTCDRCFSSLMHDLGKGASLPEQWEVLHTAPEREHFGSPERTVEICYHCVRSLREWLQRGQAAKDPSA